MTAERRNVFLVGLNAFNRAKLENLTDAERIAFHGLLDEPYHYDVPGMLRKAEAELRAFPGRVDAVVGYIDFPISTMLPILCERLGLRSPSLESLLRCEHKYWARLEQSRVAPECVPRFAAVDPFDDAALAGLDLPYPFWLKPVKASGSYLGFRVHDQRSFRRAVAEIRAGIGRLAEPFDFVLRHAKLPPEVAPVGGRHCIAEEILSGRQCTLEGYVFEGEVGFHGVVDSIRTRNRHSFARYEYPSRLPRSVRERMQEVTTAVLTHVGFDTSGFNVEFFWDPSRDRIGLLEVNTRIAQHHSDLFEKVDGITNHEVPVQIALGRHPCIPHRRGPFHHAGTFFLRAFHDARVTEVPDAEAVEAVERRFPGTVVQLQVEPGMRLADLHEQDSYSYNLAIVYLGARSHRELLARWRACQDMLRFGLDPEAA